MRQWARRGMRWGVLVTYMWWAFVCSACGEAERGGQRGKRVQVFAEGWTADGLLIGSRRGELYSFKLHEGTFEIATIEVRDSVAFSSGVRCENGTLLAGLADNGQRVSELYCWAGEGAAERCGVDINSNLIAGIGCEVVAISQGAIRSAGVAPGGSIILHEDIVLEEPKSIAVGRRLVASGGSIMVSSADGGIIEIDRHTGKTVDRVVDSDSGMSLLYCDEGYIIQSAPRRIVFRNRISKVVERGVSVRGIPVGIVRTTASAGPGVRYFAIVRFDDVLECDIVDLDTMEYVEVSGISPINIIQ